MLVSAGYAVNITQMIVSMYRYRLTYADQPSGEFLRAQLGDRAQQLTFTWLGSNAQGSDPMK